MVKKFIMKLVFQHGSKVLKSVFAAYKDITAGGKTASDQANTNNPTSKFNFTNLMYTPMTREEALKILNFKEDDLKAETQAEGQSGESETPKSHGSNLIIEVIK